MDGLIDKLEVLAKESLEKIAKNLLIQKKEE